MDLMTRLRSQWDRLLAGAAAVAGVVVLVLGWIGVSGSAYPAEQLPYIISGGVGGLFLLGLSSVLWLSADLHDEWRKLDRIEQAIRAAGELPVDAPSDFAEEEARTEHLPAVSAS
jgi:hypothetical protein